MAEYIVREDEVRCKDCKYRKTIFCNMVHETMGNGMVDYARDDDYCSRAERRNDDATD